MVVVGVAAARMPLLLVVVVVVEEHHLRRQSPPPQDQCLSLVVSVVDSTTTSVRVDREPFLEPWVVVPSGCCWTMTTWPRGSWGKSGFLPGCRCRGCNSVVSFVGLRRCVSRCLWFVLLCCVYTDSDSDWYRKVLVVTFLVSSCCGRIVFLGRRLLGYCSAWELRQLRNNPTPHQCIDNDWVFLLFARSSKVSGLSQVVTLFVVPLVFWLAVESVDRYRWRMGMGSSSCAVLEERPTQESTGRRYVTCHDVTWFDALPNATLLSRTKGVAGSPLFVCSPRGELSLRLL